MEDCRDFRISLTAKEREVLPLDHHWSDTEFRQLVVYGIIVIIPISEH